MNDFDSILTRMKERMPDGVTTLEGSFAGDILQAVAGELARIYAQEIETVLDRAFVATAEGEWLDLACRDYGITRLRGEEANAPDESDEALRKRAFDKIRQFATSGNAASYAAWALELPHVRAALAIPTARGPGSVDVYVLLAETAPGGALAAVTQHLEDNRPLCVDLAVREAQPMPVGISARLTLTADTTLAAAEAELTARYAEYLASVALSERGTVVSLNRIAALLMDIPGVADAEDIRIAGQAASLPVPVGVYAVADGVTLTEAVIG